MKHANPILKFSTVPVIILMLSSIIPLGLLMDGTLAEKNPFDVGVDPNDPILIWDNDGGSMPGGQKGSEEALNSTLISLGFKNITITNQSEDLANYTLDNYKFFFALFGESGSMGHITPAQENQIANYLDNDGKLYIEGPDIGYHAVGGGNGEFAILWPYLHGVYISNGINMNMVFGNVGSMAEGIWMVLDPIQQSSDRIDPAAEAEPVFNFCHGICYNGSYRTVFFTFQFAAMQDGNGQNNKKNLMNNLMFFLGLVYVRDVEVQGLNWDREEYSFTRDLEATDWGCTHSGGADEWEYGNASQGPGGSYSGVKGWGIDNDDEYENDANNWLNLPTLVLDPGYQQATLSFYHWYKTQANNDGGWLEIWDPLENSYANLTPSGNYPSQLAGNSPFQNLRCYGGSSNAWRKATFDLTPWLGHAVNIRLRFWSNNAITSDGWYIDNITFSLKNGDSRTYINDNVTLAPGDQFKYNATVKNLGMQKESFPVLCTIRYDSNGTIVWQESVDVFDLDIEKSTKVGFPAWTTPLLDHQYYTVNISSNAAEENASDANNFQITSVYVGEQYDLAVEKIYTEPTDPSWSRKDIELAASFKNLGNMDADNFQAKCQIRAQDNTVVYDETQSGLKLGSPHGNMSYVHFPQWQTPAQEDTYTINVSVIWGADENETNDYTTIDFDVSNNHDAGIVPNSDLKVLGFNSSGYYPTENHILKYDVRNYGNMPDDFIVDISYDNPNTYMAESFENPGGWTTYSSQGEQLFRRMHTSQKYYSGHHGQYSYWFGDPNTGFYKDGITNLLTSSMNLAGYNRCVLSIWVNYDFHPKDMAEIVYSYSSMSNIDGYQPLVTLRGTSNGWKQLWIDLEDQSNRGTVYLGFRVSTDPGDGHDKIGLYIDELNIYGQMGSFNPIRQDNVNNLLEYTDLTKETSTALSNEGLIYLKAGTRFASHTDSNNGNNEVLNYTHVKDMVDVSVVDVKPSLGQQYSQYFGFEDTGDVWTKVREDDQKGFGFSQDHPFAGPLFAPQDKSCLATNPYGFYGGDEDCHATAEIDLAYYEKPTLKFLHWYQIEEGKDGGWIFARKKGDANFMLMTPVGGYPTMINKPGLGDIWCFSGNSSGYEEVVIDFSRFAGEEIELQFNFYSNDRINKTGWYIDHVTMFDMTKDVDFVYNKQKSVNVEAIIRNHGTIDLTNIDVELSVESENGAHTFTSTANIAALARDQATTVTFPDPWVTPNFNNKCKLNVSLSQANDFRELNDIYTLDMLVNDTHNLKILRFNTPKDKYPLEGGVNTEFNITVGNNGTHDETDWDIELTILSQEDGAVPTVLSDKISVLKGNVSDISFYWAVPEKVGLRYTITLRITDPRDDFQFDNSQSIFIYTFNISMKQTLYGFVYDDSPDSPFYDQRIANATVTLVDQANNPIQNTTTDEFGYYFFSLDPYTLPKSMKLSVYSDWYDPFISGLIFMDANVVTKYDPNLKLNNHLPVMSLRTDLLFAPVLKNSMKPGMALSTHPIMFNWSSTIDTDLPKQVLTFTLRSDLQGILYHGSAMFANISLMEGYHNITLNVTDQMLGENQTWAHIEVFEPDIYEYKSSDDRVKIVAYYGGTGSIAISSTKRHDLPEDKVFVGEFYKIEHTGKGLIAWWDLTMYYYEHEMPLGTKYQEYRIHYFDHNDESDWIYKWVQSPEPAGEIEKYTINSNFTTMINELHFDVSIFTPKDLVPPDVLWTKPGNNEENVSIDSVVEIAFSEEINFDDIDSDSIRLGSGTGQLEEIDFEYDHETYILTIIPVRRMAPESEYSVALYSISDLLNNELDLYNFTFVTGTLNNESLSGIVTDSRGKALEGVNIIVNEVIMNISGPDGKFKFNIDPGTYSIIANKSGYFDDIITDQLVKIGHPISDLEFSMLEYDSGDLFVLKGRIIDSDGEAMEGVSIELSGALYKLLTTDSSGNFQATLLEGAYELIVSKEGYATHTNLSYIVGSEDLLEIVLELNIYGYFKGKVVDTMGNAIALVDISFKSQDGIITSTQSSSDGTFDLKLEEGFYTITLSKEGFKNKVLPNKEIVSELDTDLGNIDLAKEDKVVLDEDKGGASWGLITGIIIAIVVVLIIVGAIIFMVVLKKRRENEEVEPKPGLPGVTDPEMGVPEGDQGGIPPEFPAQGAPETMPQEEYGFGDQYQPDPEASMFMSAEPEQEYYDEVQEPKEYDEDSEEIELQGDFDEDFSPEEIFGGLGDNEIADENILPGTPEYMALEGDKYKMLPAAGEGTVDDDADESMEISETEIEAEESEEVSVEFEEEDEEEIEVEEKDVETETSQEDQAEEEDSLDDVFGPDEDEENVESGDEDFEEIEVEEEDIGQDDGLGDIFDEDNDFQESLDLLDD